MIRRLLGGLGTLVVLFHGWLLAGQAWDGQLADPAVLVQWLAACGLVASLWALRRSGTSTFSRRGVALWVLAAWLHGPAVATLADAAGTALPEAATAAALVAQAAGATALVLGTLLLALASRGPRRATRLVASTIGSPAHGLAASPGFAVTVAGRPPPGR